MRTRIRPLLLSLRTALKPGGRLDVVDFVPDAAVVQEHCEEAGFRLTRALTSEPRLGDDYYLVEFTPALDGKVDPDHRPDVTEELH